MNRRKVQVSEERAKEIWLKNRRYTLQRKAKDFSYVNSESREIYIDDSGLKKLTFEDCFVISELVQVYGYTLFKNKRHWVDENELGPRRYGGNTRQSVSVGN